MKKFTIETGPWSSNILVICGGKFEAALDQFEEWIGAKTEEDRTEPDSTIAYTLDASEVCGHVLIWFRELRPKASTVVHEAVHAAHKILDYRGSSCEEALAYLVQFIFEDIQKAIR